MLLTLTHFQPKFYFCTPWRHRKTSSFLIISGVWRGSNGWKRVKYILENIDYTWLINGESFFLMQKSHHLSLYRSVVCFFLLEMKVQKVSPTNMKKIEKDDIVLPDDIFSQGVLLFLYFDLRAPGFDEILFYVRRFFCGYHELQFQLLNIYRFYFCTFFKLHLLLKSI